MQVYTIHQPEKMNNARLLLSVVVFIIILILYVSQQMYIVSLEKGVNILRQRKNDLAAEVTVLEVRAADLHKGNRIQKIASECLGMSLPVGAPEKLF